MLFLHRIFNSVWLIDPDYATNLLPYISSYIKGERVVQASKEDRYYDSDNGVLFATRQKDLYQVSDYGGFAPPEKAPVDSIAIINIVGAITKHDQACGPSGMATKAALLERCYANPNIKGVIINQETGGGEAGAMRLMNGAIAKRDKPVVGFVNDYSCSAGMGNIAACDYIVANHNLARVGSIGTYLTIVDYSEKLKNEGINLIEIYATASKDKNKEFYEALKGNVEPLREMVDAINEDFINMIATQRKETLTAGRDVWGTGKTFFADKAVDLGLIDAVDSFDNILNYFNT